MFTEAAECYTRCIELDGSRSAAYNNRSLCFLRLKKWDAAKADAMEVLAIEPKNTKAMLRGAQACAGMGAYDEAGAAYEAVIALEPKNAKAKQERDEVKMKAIDAQLTAIRRQQEEMEKQRREAVDMVAELARSTEEVSGNVVKTKGELKVKEDALAKASSEIDTGLATMKDTLTDEVEIAEIEAKVKAAKSAAESKAPDAKKSVEEAVTAAKSAGSRGGVSVKNAKKKATPKKKTAPKKKTGSPSKAKVDAMAFMSKVDSLATQPEVLGEYLVTIPAEALPRLISNRLEADHMVALLKAAELLEPHKGYSILNFLTTVARFDMAAMFLADTDRAVAASAFAKIKDAAELGKIPGVSGADVAKVASKYCA